MAVVVLLVEGAGIGAPYISNLFQFAVSSPLDTTGQR